jgi:cytochrome c peroxidase
MKRFHRTVAGALVGGGLLLVGVGASAAVGGHRPSAQVAEQARRLVARIEAESVKQPATAAGTEDLVALGEELFFNGTFDGNGRTCGTCHRQVDAFGLSPASIAALPPSDPLFIAELDTNLAGLEHPPLMRSPRALILENIDGFTSPPVFRNSPHLLNLAHTAPYGLSGEFTELRTFSMGAVVQHFPKTLARQPGVDFRLPTAQELAALEAFMQSIALPADQNFELSRFVSTVAQRRGSDLFFGTARCFNCHNGPVLADAIPAHGGGNRNFNTGVVNLRINLENRPENPGGGPLPQEMGGARLFNTPPLIGVARTAPFFHDSSAATLREAVAFYDSVEFKSSPGGHLVGEVALPPGQIDDLTAFLEGLQPLTFEVSPRALQFGAREVTAGASPALRVTVANLVADPLDIESVALSGGPDDGDFTVTAVDPLTFDVTFDPTAVGQKRAVLQVSTAAGDVGVRLAGTGFRSGLPTFADVPPTDPAFGFVEALFRAGLTNGCGGGNFCPDKVINRAESAVWLVLAMGNTEVPPRRRFADVIPTTLGAGFIERLAADGITAGCGNGNYCPGSPVTRRQLAVFLVAASGRTPIQPATGLFADVPPGSPAAGFIERLAADGITAGCGNGNYCPDAPTTRRQMAILLARAFDLPLP